MTGYQDISLQNNDDSHAYSNQFEKPDGIKRNNKRKLLDSSLPNLDSLNDCLKPEEIEKILKESENRPIEPLNSNGVKRIVLQLGKKIKKNQEDRIKYPDDPEKFLKSEVDLDEVIKKIKDLGAFSDLLDNFIEFGGIPPLVSLLSHANTDIQIEVISVLVDLTDPDVVTEIKDPTKFIEELFKLQLAELVVDTLIKINEDDSEEDYAAVSDTFQLIENLTDIMPDFACNKFQKISKFITWLLRRIRQSNRIDYNRVYATEILSIILRNSGECREWIGKKNGADGIEKLLRGIALYRKKNPASSDEEEIVQNLFDCLCNLMLVPAHRVTFGVSQGLDLMIRMMKQQNFSSRLALKLTDYAVESTPSNCQTFVEKLGLKPLFGIFMKKITLSRANSKNELVDEEHTCSIINSLCTHCTDVALARVLNKFAENKFEKIEHLIELHDKYQAKVGSKRNYSKIKTVDSIVPELNDTLNISLDDQGYLENCEKGLFVLQKVDLIILSLPTMGNFLVSTVLFRMLHIKGINSEEIIKNITDYQNDLDESAVEEKKKIDEMIKYYNDARNNMS